MPISLEQWRAAVNRWVARIQRTLIIRRGVKRPPSCDSSQEGAPSPSGQPHSGEKKCMMKKKGRKKRKDKPAITTDDFYDGMIALAAIVAYLGKTEYKHSFDTTPVGPLKELLGYPGVGALLVVIMILLLRSGDVEVNPGPVERGTHILLNISSKPTLPQLDKLIVSSVAGDWEQVATHLRVEPFLIDTVKADNPGHCEEACRGVLNRWLNAEPGSGTMERTWPSVLKVLEESGYRQVALQLRREHFEESSEGRASELTSPPVEGGGERQVESFWLRWLYTSMKIDVLVDFILWHTTLVAFNIFLLLCLILHKYELAHLTMGETWWKFKKTASQSGNRGISSPCQKTRVFLCIFVRCPLTVCMAVVKRYEHRAVSKQVCGLVAKLPSLRLRRGIKCGRRIQGCLVVSFIVQRSFMMPIRSQPSTFCLAFLRRAACIAKWLSQAVFKPHLFLRGLLLLAGDVETNPGPIQAELVLNEYRDRFISEMDANAVFRDLFHHGIISDGDQETIAKADSRMRRNGILHACLLRTCTNDALLRACGIIVSVQGDPKMSVLGEDMRKRLESVEGGGGPDGGSGSEGKKEFQHFSDVLRAEYTKIAVVYAPHKQDQVMEFINLALSRFKLDFEYDTLRFVRSMTEGIDKVYTELQRKVEYNSIIPLVKEHRLVVISGAPGTGKSTLAKKLCQDVSRNMESLSYKLVVKVELRDLVPLVLEPSSFGLEQLMELFASAGQVETVVQRMKATGGADMLLILDGYDELPHELRHSPFFVNLLTHSLESPLPLSHIIFTSRSIVMSEIYHHFTSAQFPFVNIEVLGFTSEQIQLFIDQYFQGEGISELSAKLSAKLDALPHIKGLCSIPVVLSIISRVFLSRKDLPPTLTQIYDDFVCETLSPMFPGLQSTLKLPLQDHDFLKLCEIAYHCTKQQKLIFTKSDLLGLQYKYSDRQTGCGLLTARPVDKLRFVIAESFYFIHLTVQEFLCAVHIALLEVAAQRAIWDEHLGQPHMAQTWRFYCGVTKLEHYDLLQNSTIRRIMDFDELLMQSFFETQYEDLVAKLMPSVMGDEVKVHPNTSYDSLAFGFCLEQHHSLQHLTVCLPSGEVVTDVKHLLEPCLRHQQLQTLTIGGPNTAEDCKQIEDLFDRIRNCDGALKGHFGKVKLLYSPLSVAVKVLCLQHVREFECVDIKECEAMDPEVLREMEKALKENKTLEKLTLRDYETLPKEYCRHILLGTRQNTSLSEIDLDFHPHTWDCQYDVPADAQGSVQHVTLWNVAMDMLPKLWSWFSQVKQLECCEICPPQKDGVRKEDMLKELEHTLSGMGMLEKLVLGISSNWPDSLTLTFGLSILKTIAKNHHIMAFVLYDCSRRDSILHDMLGGLTSDQRTRFTIEVYTNEYGTTFPWICLSASGPTHQLLKVGAGVSSAARRREHGPPPAHLAGPTHQLLEVGAGASSAARRREHGPPPAHLAETTKEDNSVDTREDHVSQPDQEWQEFKQHYAHAVESYANVRLNVTKCTTIGPPRVGKTCLKYLLTNQKWDVQDGTASTDVMEAPEWVECLSIQKGGANKLWRLMSKEEIQTATLKTITDKVWTEPVAESEFDSTPTPGMKSPTQPTTSTVSEQPTVASNIAEQGTAASTMAKQYTVASTRTEQPTAFSTSAGQVTGTPTTPTRSSNAATPDPEVPVTLSCMQCLEAISQCNSKDLLQRLKDKSGMVLGSTELIYFVDTGGQAIYHDVHPVLITSPSVYLVVFSLNDFYGKTDDKKLMSEYFRSSLIQRPLRSILTFGCETSESDKRGFPQDPKIFIIGTHLDVLPQGNDRVEILDHLHQIIAGEIRHTPYRQFVQYDRYGRSFWAVDNTEAGKGQKIESAHENYISLLRERIQDKRMMMSRKVPIPWFLLRLVMISNGVQYCTYSQLLKEAESMGYIRKGSQAKDLNAMLKLFHMLGLVYYRIPEGCTEDESLVFIDPDCLFSTTTNFLMAAKEELKDNGSGSDKLGQVGVVEKNKVVQRMEENLVQIWKETAVLLQKVERTMMNLHQTSMRTVLESIGDCLKEEKDPSEVTKRKGITLSQKLWSHLKASLTVGDMALVKQQVQKALNDFWCGCRKGRKSIQSTDMPVFLALLSDLRIIANVHRGQLIGSDFYVIPSALPMSKESKATRRTNPNSILITVLSQSILRACYLPSGLFCALLSCLVTTSGWSITPLDREHVVFTHDSVHGQVHVIEWDPFLEIYLEVKASPKALKDSCRIVKKTVDKALCDVYSKFFCCPLPLAASVNPSPIIWGFPCKAHPGKPDEKTHIAAFQRDEDECWAECLLEGSIALQAVSTEQLLWFQ